MKTFDELTDVEKALRSLIFAYQTKNLKHKNHPMCLGEAYLYLQYTEALDVAKQTGIPLVEFDINDYERVPQ